MTSSTAMPGKINGAHLWWRQMGSGQAVVLLPGGSGLASDYLDPVAAILADDARVIQWDPRGCGRSQPSGPYDLGTTLSDLDALRDHLEIDEWVLVGHSAGASIGVAYALEYPRHTSGLICIAGGSGLHDDRQWHAAYETAAKAGRDAVPDTRYPSNPEVNRVANASWRRYIKEPSLLRRVSELSMPLLAIHGTADIRPSWPMEQLAQLAPNGEFVSIQEAGHIPWTTHGEHISTLLRNFLRACAARPTSQSGC